MKGGLFLKNGYIMGMFDDSGFRQAMAGNFSSLGGYFKMNEPSGLFSVYGLPMNGKRAV